VVVDSPRVRSQGMSRIIVLIYIYIYIYIYFKYILEHVGFHALHFVVIIIIIIIYICFASILE